MLACSARVHLAKTKFVLHAGLAFGAFHRYILEPYRAGAFRKGAPGRTKALVKAGAAGLFAYRELKGRARRRGLRRRSAASACDVPLKRDPRAAALRALKTGGGLGAIGAAGAALDRLGAQSASGGAPIKDINR